ncbi:Aste57867_3754 [Aphanomyces stellatus]|uniref:Aste57867_3754 protein n=1 Tax=Aphanomyces stellatus TaxID=120398 RepID=A0A485KCQ2_9STRA|nr:hypothetical protein As57867_003743 [Aphanomyces stellatus]VFT80905.1 Aste57867_3754 [Aphanomyces stellatus]
MATRLVTKPAAKAARSISSSGASSATDSSASLPVMDATASTRMYRFSEHFAGVGTRFSNPFTRGTIVDRDIKVAHDPAMPSADASLKAPSYNGRHKRWPGILLMTLLVLGSVVGIIVFAAKSSSASIERRDAVQLAMANRARIDSGLETIGAKRDHIDDDGIVNNPKQYKPMGCELPDYQSKKGKIWAVGKNGTEVPVSIKGVNWFGMETGMQAPFGLWDNDQNGTTVYAIADFLSLNNFNSVRMPLCLENILENKPLEANIINRVTNRALDMSSYIHLLQSIVKGLGYRSISVLISMHTLNRMNDAGSLWYGKGFTEDQFMTAIDVLTKNLCSDTYWNILGIDVKNEPFAGSWGDGEKADFKAGAERIAARMLRGCPKWMAFVEGINQQHEIVLDGKEYGYYDWFGGGLHSAKKFPPTFVTDNKLVYAPHYYTPAVFPQYYLYGGGNVTKDSAIANYIELDTPTLKGRVKATMYDMFGYLNANKGPAVLLGEFAGLYTKDAHPMKTTQRCTDLTIEIAVEEGYAGAYMWSLNPESAYQFNPSDKPGTYIEGLLELDWRTPNKPFLTAMKGLDHLKDLKPMPCFPIEKAAATP